MSYIVGGTSQTSPYGISSDAAGRSRSSNLSTLFDGKTINYDSDELFETTGTGSWTFSENTMQMSVSAGQYVVRQAYHFSPYFSGKSQLTELTFDTFAPQAGVTKRIGYFSSSTTAPYDTVFDGWYLESSGGTLTFVISKLGTPVYSVPMTSWMGYNSIQSYNWNNFTVILVDFLWLGGAILRFFIKDPNGGFTLLHTFDYAGTAAGTFMGSPNQPIRYEISSTTGSGSLTAVCSQVSSEGAIAEPNRSAGLYNPSLLSTGTLNTIYALKGIKRLTTDRDSPLQIVRYGLAISTNDAGVAMLLLNPTLSTPLSYTNMTQYQDGTALSGTTISNVGKILDCFPIRAAGTSESLFGNTMTWLSSKLDGTLNEYVVAYTPLTSGQSVAATMNIIKY